MLASTSLYTLNFVSLLYRPLTWSLFTLLVSYPVEQARRQNIHVVGRAQPYSGLWANYKCYHVTTTFLLRVRRCLFGV
jgi:hypothetical protein